MAPNEKGAAVMREWLKSVKWNLVLAALAYVVLGVVLLVWPDTTGNVLCTLLGILLLGYGIFQIIGFFTRGDEGWGSGAVYLLVGLCAVALGVLALSDPEKVLSILPVALGAVVVVDSCMSLKRAFQLKELRMERWWVVALLAVVTLLFGLVVMFNPFQSAILVTRIVGGVLIYQGISDLVSVSRLSYYGKRILEELGAVEGEVTKEEDL